MDVLSFPLPPPIAISLAVVILTVLVIRFRARRLGAEKKKIYHPVVTNFLNTLINFPRLHHYMTEFEHKHKSYRAYNVLIDYIITTDPANVEYILKTNFANYGKGWYHSGVSSDVLGDGIFAVDGEKWLHQRKVAGNELTTKVLKDFSSTVFKTNAVKLARIISEAATCNKAVEIQLPWPSINCSECMRLDGCNFSGFIPVGIAIGVGISDVYDVKRPTALIINGVFNAASAAAGIFIYTSLFSS
ncbi:hypothetical protein C1H46_016970 [Malus baccata]|uniref:Cytochrome P450 n=1 Tax=Malus baccata TaxID=106549 RepID=A0A540MF79_MALBA|nr:hypothetical protein C1H46_016970 [Malus baccata]